MYLLELLHLVVHFGLTGYTKNANVIQNLDLWLKLNKIFSIINVTIIINTSLKGTGLKHKTTGLNQMLSYKSNLSEIEQLQVNQ